MADYMSEESQTASHMEEEVDYELKADIEDSGKSTIGGQILYLSGQVDKRTIEKFEKEAKDKHRESWYMAYIMDINEDERVKGITVEVGRAHFETETTRFTILDAPGHKIYVPNMITGASQADIGVLTLGVSKLVVVVNKMDDPTVNWSRQRYEEIMSKMSHFSNIMFLPISGLRGTNIQTRVERDACSWFDGQCLFEALDGIEVAPLDPNGPFRMPIMDKVKELGTVLMGKVRVVAIYCDEERVRSAGPGETLSVRVSGIEVEDIRSGFILSSIETPIPVVQKFIVQLQILELEVLGFLFPN
ncbi:eukaryotic peptide chain release factor GTP-binding subunit ERF3A isoform X1 [Tanacetum coccineum]